jgi:regulator of protease activity HflC (stomatin/prohibitin superfamily)
MKRRTAWLRAAALALAAVAATSCIRTVDSGESAVLWKMFGGTQPGVYGEGVHLVMPWNRLTRYDVRTQDRKEVLHVLTNNGLSVSLETSIRYRPQAAELPMLHAEIGPEYFEVILAPVVRSEARKVGGRYAPEEIYSSKREVVEHEIKDEVQRAIAGKHVDLEAILIRDVDLPDNIKRAISEKLEEEQKALKMEFTLNRERQEAERKRIEAAGIADFQKIVATGISGELLRWKGIEATEKLATSANAKVVVIGSPKEGLPLILGGS